MEIVKIDKKDKDIETNKIIRVAAYVRVSSDRDQSMLSFNNQVDYYKYKIGENPNWIFAGIYTDEGITGSTITYRNGFKKLLLDGERNKFDLILTKSISRFARNTLDTIKYVRFFKERNIRIIFEEENLDTMDMNGELILTILASIAQQEITNLTDSIKYGQRELMKSGRLMTNGYTYGYDYNVKTQSFKINKKEAEVVKLIFDLYLQGNGVRKITNRLYELNIPTKTGNKRWNDSYVLKMLKNEKYTGDLLLGKYCTVNRLEHKRLVENRGYQDKFLIKNHHEPIISHEDFEKVQRLMKQKYPSCLTKNDGAHNRYSLSGRLRCGFCHAPMNRKNSKDKSPYYRCSAITKNDCSYCPHSRSIKEEIIKEIFAELVSKLRNFSLKEDNIIIREKYNYVKKVINSNKSKEYDEELFKRLIHCYLIGLVENNPEPFTIKVILKSNYIFNERPTRKEMNNIKLHELFRYDSNVITNYREHQGGKLYLVDYIKIIVTLDLGGDI